MPVDSGNSNPEAFFKKLMRALDQLFVAAEVDEDEDMICVRIPLRAWYLPERIHTPYPVDGRYWHWRFEYEREGRFEDWLRLLANRIAEKMGYGSDNELPYFEPGDFEWYFIIPRPRRKRAKRTNKRAG